MAQPRSASRGGTATKARPGNKTPGTPEINESKIYRMRVDEIRGQLRRRGVGGTSGQRKDELVKSLIKAMKAEIRGGRAPAKKAAPKKRAPAGKRTAAAQKKTAPAQKKAAARKKAAPAQKKAAPARKSAAAKKTTSTAGRGAAARKSTAEERTTAPSGGRAGTQESRSLMYAQPISSLDERPTRPGRSLVTSDAQVIRAWAQARDGQPATIEGTERDGRPGVLTFDFPGYRSGGRLRPVSWDDWLGTFDGRRLNFIYQEQKTNGVQSNFFRLESPDREDA